MNCKNKAFTLAEILLTLTIVGIVAMLTIPPLVTEVNKKQYTAGFLQAYSMLSEATALLMEQNNGTMANVGPNLGFSYYPRFDTELRDAYCTVLNCVNKCPYRSWNVASDCLPDWAYTLAGNDYITSDTWYGTPTILSNGMWIKFTTLMSDYDDCEHSLSIDSDGNPDGCTQFIIDVNGLKGPNTLGRDMFNFAVVKHGIKLRPYSSTLCNPTGDHNQNGSRCGAKIILDGNQMTY